MLKTGPDVTGLSRPEAREARICFWREKVTEALASGQTQTEFCGAQGISTGAYFWWKRVLNRLDKGAKPAAKSRARPKTAFLPVTVREPASGARAPYALEIALGVDRVVRVREGCDPKFLETVVRLVGGLPC
jgi:hypothetical protein